MNADLIDGTRRSTRLVKRRTRGCRHQIGRRKMGARNAKQVEGNVGADELYITDEEIAEIERRNTYEPELVTAV